MTKTLMEYQQNQPWIIKENSFDNNFLSKCESVFALGNGYLGVRSAFEENYIGEKRDMFVSGTFDRFDKSEVTELPNVPDFIQMEFVINGRNLDLNLGEITQYSFSLNLKTGQLIRHFIWKFADIHLEFNFRRFVSFDDLHLLGQEVTIRNLGADTSFQLKSGIDGQLTNSGSQHFAEGTKDQEKNRILQMVSTTAQSRIDFVQSTIHDFSDRSLIDKARIEISRRQIHKLYWFHLKSNRSIKISKLSNVYTSIDRDLNQKTVEYMISVSANVLNFDVQKGFDYLLKKSALAWEEKVWRDFPIEIKSIDFTDQLALNFARYHLHIMVPKHDGRMSIAAKGLSGEGYKGHTAWDTDIFMLPYFTMTYPEIARKLLTYRYLGLSGAHKKAALNHYQGAQYPWESAWPSNGEVAPVWGAADIVTGKPTKIWSGFIEQHISSDVAFGVKQYIDATSDLRFAKFEGYEMIFDTAKFWVSRLEYNAVKDRYEINNVVGPDEYKEHVNNNAFTNYSAAWNISTAIKVYEKIKQQDSKSFDRLNKKLGLDKTYRQWKEKLPKLYLPKANKDKILPQDDSYLSKKILDLTPYLKDDAVGTLFHDYNLDQVNNMQITKQADVILLFCLFENIFSLGIQEASWDYYLPKTMHDSSLSLSTHVVLAVDLGRNSEAYQLFQKAKNIDLGPYMNSSNDGIHAASLGGIWNSVVEGFGGLRVIDGKLRIEPHLPKEWDSLDYRINWHGARLQISETKEDFTVTFLNSNHLNQIVEFMSKGQKYQVKAKGSLRIKL